MSKSLQCNLIKVANPFLEKLEKRSVNAADTAHAMLECMAFFGLQCEGN